MSDMHDFGDGPMPAHRHPNGGGWVAETATLDETVCLEGNASIGDDARIWGNARIETNDDYVCLGPLGSRGACLTITFRPALQFVTGCFQGNKHAFEAAVTRTHDNNAHGRAYRVAIALAEALAAIRAEQAPGVESETQS